MTKLSDLPAELQQQAPLIPIQVPLWVGRATIAWNTLSHSLFDVYRRLSGLDDSAARGTFFVVTSDRSQRDMVSALVETQLKPHSQKLAKEMQSAIGRVNGLSGKRNDVLHVIFLDSESPTAVSQFHERGHLKGKRGFDLVTAIHELTIACLDLSFEIQGIHGRMLDLPHFQGKLLGEAILRYSAQRKSEELANSGEFGLLGSFLKTPPSPPETQENE